MKRFILVILFAILCLAGCHDNSYSVLEDAYQQLLLEVSQVVTDDIVLPEKIRDVTLSYESDNQNIVLNNGVINRPEVDTLIKINVLLTYKKTILNKELMITVSAKVYQYIEENINVVTGKYSLPGKLTVPISASKVPVVILIHGSGASDMDGTISALKPFKDIALGFAEAGIATIRYNKRVYQYIAEFVNNYNATIEDEIICDVLSAVNILKNDERIDTDNIFLVGHSLGANVVPLILNRQPDLQGGVMLAASPGHILDLLLEQVKVQSGAAYLIEKPKIDIIKSLSQVREENKLNYGCYDAYWVYYNAIDFIEETRSAASNNHLLMLQGGLDLQVFPKYFDKFQELLAGYNVDYKYYEILNHVFCDGYGETIYTAYQTYKPVAKEVIHDISIWIKANKA